MRVPSWLQYVGLARELLTELKQARNHGSFATINARLVALLAARSLDRAVLSRIEERIKNMAGELEALKGTVASLVSSVSGIEVEQGRIVGELREINEKLGNVTDPQEIGAITTQIDGLVQRLEASRANLKAATDEVDTDGSNPAPTQGENQQ